METLSKLTYPTAIKRRVKGDWNCENCHNLNFSFRNSCNLCGQDKNIRVIFSYAIYLNINTSDRDWNVDTPHPAKITLSNLPSVTEFFKLTFMQKPMEIYPLTSRH